MPAVADFVQLLADALTDAGLTPAVFARKVGVPRSFLSMVLSGQRKPPLARLESWADALGLRDEPRDLFLDEGSLLASPPRIQALVGRLRVSTGKAMGRDRPTSRRR